MTRVALVVAPYHPPVEEMVAVALAEIEQLPNMQAVLIRRVGGAVEIPLQCKRLLREANVDCVVALGAIENGETLHGLIIGQGVFSELLKISLDYDKPIGFGIIGPGATSEQIVARAHRVAIDAVRSLIFSDQELPQ